MEGKEVERGRSSDLSGCRTPPSAPGRPESAPGSRLRELGFPGAARSSPFPLRSVALGRLAPAACYSSKVKVAAWGSATTSLSLTTDPQGLHCGQSPGRCGR